MKDIFICHASEDKINVVYPLIERLECHNVSYWLDKTEIRWGDSITQKINDGLVNSRYGVVILSKSFLNKNWPQRELNALLNIEASNGKAKILPLIYGDSGELLKNLPLLNDKMFLNWDDGIDSIIYELQRKLDDNFHSFPVNKGDEIKNLYTEALLKMHDLLFSDAKRILGSYRSNKPDNIKIQLILIVCELAEKPLYSLRREYIDSLSKKLNSNFYYKEPLTIFLLAILHLEYYQVKRLKPIGVNSKELLQKTKEINIAKEDVELLKFIKFSDKTSILLRIF